MSPRPSASPTFDVSHLAVHALWWAWFPSLLLSWSHLSVTGRAALLVAGFVLLFWNYAVLHDHMHVPIACPPALRWLVSRTLGLACGFAYRGYHHHPFNHHQYNDGEGDWDGAAPARARSSTWCAPPSRPGSGPTGCWARCGRSPPGRLVRPTLQPPLASLHPTWVTRLVQSYAAPPCAPQKDSTTTSETPSAAT